MSWIRIFLLLWLVAVGPVWAGDPGEQFWALEKIRKADAKLDAEASDVARRLNANQITALVAANEWESLLWLANKHVKDVEALQGRDWPRAAASMLGLARLQADRLEGLMKAAQLERDQGLAAARPSWDRQLKVYQKYKTHKQKVAAEFRYIQENP